MATKPSIRAQNTRCGLGESSFPPEVRWSTTSDPESDEVTKNEISSRMPTIETKYVHGKALQHHEQGRSPRSR